MNNKETIVPCGTKENPFVIASCDAILYDESERLFDDEEDGDCETIPEVNVSGKIS